MGTIILGKVESGVVYKGQQYLVMPNKVTSDYFLLVLTTVFCQIGLSTYPMNMVSWADMFIDISQ